MVYKNLFMKLQKLVRHSSFPKNNTHPWKQSDLNHWVLADENYWIKQIVSYWKSKLQVWVTLTTEILTPDQALGTANTICFQTHRPCCWQNSCRVLQWNQNKSKSGRLENLAPKWLQNASKTLSCNHSIGVGMEFQLEVHPNPFVGSEWPLPNSVFGVRHQNSWSREPGRRQNSCWKNLKDSGRKLVGSALPPPADTAQPQQLQGTNKRQENTTYGS